MVHFSECSTVTVNCNNETQLQMRYGHTGLLNTSLLRRQFVSRCQRPPRRQCPPLSCRGGLWAVLLVAAADQPPPLLRVGMSPRRGSRRRGEVDLEEPLAAGLGALEVLDVLLGDGADPVEGLRQAGQKLLPGESSTVQFRILICVLAF